jgi:hypothetical protein
MARDSSWALHSLAHPSLDLATKRHKKLKKKKLKKEIKSSIPFSKNVFVPCVPFCG